MKNQPKQTCGTCRYGVFRMTNHKPPRPVAFSTGQCIFPLPELPPLPMWVKVTVGHGYTCPEHGNGFTKCPTWEAKCD